MDIFENFNNQSGSKFSEDGDYRSNEMIKSKDNIKTLKGQNVFTFSQIMENEHESSYQSSTYQQNDDFDNFMVQGNIPAPSPVNRRQDNNDFFDFEMAGNEIKYEDKKKEDKDYFDDFE